MSWGVYICGPGIVGWMLMDASNGKSPLVFEIFDNAADVARELQRQRPYHHVAARPYVDGDESRGQYAAHPDWYTP